MQMQATSIALNGRAYLITGKSGIGKSSLALNLIQRGANLIADDITEIKENIAYAPKTHQGWLEVRGVGLISGLTVCPSAKIGAIIHITDDKPERLPELHLNKVPEFQIWAQDKNQADKVLMIDSVLAGHLKLEFEKEI